MTTKHKLEDYLIFAQGSKVNDFNIDGVSQNTLPLKRKEDITLIKNKLKNIKENANIAVIGCGLTGSETIGYLIDYNKFNIKAIDGLNGPLQTFNSKITDYVKDHWNSHNVNMMFNSFVKKIDKDYIYLQDKKVNYDLAIWCGGIKKSEFSKNINNKLNLNNRFGIPVNKYLQVENTKNVFALGDCAYSGHPQTAQVAYQQGKYLANNFNNNQFNIKPFEFNNKGQICYIGRGNSVFQNNNYLFKGKLTGYLNNFIHIYNGINFNQSSTFFNMFF